MLDLYSGVMYCLEKKVLGPIEVRVVAVRLIDI